MQLLHWLIGALEVHVSHSLLASIYTGLPCRLRICLWVMDTARRVFFEDVSKAIWLPKMTIIFHHFLFTLIFQAIVYVNVHFTGVYTTQLASLSHNFFNFGQIWESNAANCFMKTRYLVAILHCSLKIDIGRHVLRRLEQKQRIIDNRFFLRMLLDNSNLTKLIQMILLLVIEKCANSCPLHPFFPLLNVVMLFLNWSLSHYFIILNTRLYQIITEL